MNFNSIYPITHIITIVMILHMHQNVYTNSDWICDYIHKRAIKIPPMQPTAVLQPQCIKTIPLKKQNVHHKSPHNRN